VILVKSITPALLTPVLTTLLRQETQNNAIKGRRNKGQQGSCKGPRILFKIEREKFEISEKFEIEGSRDRESPLYSTLIYT